MKGLRAFEMFVVALVLGVVICFCIQLSLIRGISVGEVFRGYLPSSSIVQSEGYVTTPFPLHFHLDALTICMLWDLADVSLQSLPELWHPRRNRHAP